MSKIKIKVLTEDELKEREKQDKRFMMQAITQARKAGVLNEVPIGCVIVYDGDDTGAKDNNASDVDAISANSIGSSYNTALKKGTVIGRGYNRRVTDHSTIAHAEITAIKKACRVLGDWRLEDCTMYVTLEPCPMCAGAIVQARIPRVVIGCMNPKAGCAGSVVDLLHQDKLNHQCDVTVGVLGDKCSGMLKEFFARLRKK